MIRKLFVESEKKQLVCALTQINYVPEEKRDAQDLGNILEKEGRSMIQIPNDLLDETFCAELVAEADRSMGGLDIVVTNAV